jgi:hypothetical protein
LVADGAPFPNDSSGRVGFSFNSDFEFGDKDGACCSCCSYRQEVLEISITLKINFKNGKSATTTIVSYSGPGQEDCIDKNGIPVLISGNPPALCYGYRNGKSRPGDSYDKTGCKYSMQDSPNFAIGAYLREFIKINPKAPAIDTAELKMRWRFLGRIIGTFNHGNTVWGQASEKECNTPKIQVGL